MGQSGAPVGTAFVNILPKTDGFVASLTGQLKGAITQAAGGVDASPITKSLSVGLLALGGAALDGIYKGIKATQDWVTEVQTLQRVTGQSAEGASTLAATADAMGVSVSSMSSAMTILSRNVSSNSTAIQKYGIVTTDATGATLPMDQILGEVQAKFQSLPEGVDRTTFATSLFGRAGRQLIPILGLSSDQMAEMADKAKSLGLVLSQDDIDATQKLKIAQAELGDAFKGLQIQLGKAFIPVLTALTKAMTAVVEVFARIPVPIKVATVAFLGANTAVVALRVGWGVLVKNFASLVGGFNKAADAVKAQTAATDDNTVSTFNNIAANESSNATQIGTVESYNQAANAIDAQAAATDVNTTSTAANAIASKASATSMGVLTDEVEVNGTAAAGTAAATDVLTGAIAANTIVVDADAVSLGVLTDEAAVTSGAFTALASGIAGAFAKLNTVTIPLFADLAVPLGWAALIIAAVIAITVVVVKNWDTIKRVTAEVWDGIKSAVLPVFDAIKQAVATAVQAIGPALAAVGSAVSAAVSAVVGAFTSIGQAIGNLISVYVQTFAGLWKAIGPVLLLIGKVVGAVILGAVIGALYALAGVIRVVAAVVSVAGKVIAVVFGAIAKVIQTAVNIAIDVFNVFATVVNVVASVFATLWNIIGPIVSAIGSLIASVFGEQIRVTFEAIGAVVGAFITVFAAVGRVILDAIGPPIISAFHVFQTVVGAVVSFISTAWRLIGDAVKFVVGVIIDGVNLIIKAWNDLPGHEDVQLIPTLDEISTKTDEATAATNTYVAAQTAAVAADQHRRLSADILATTLDKVPGATDAISANFNKISADMRTFSNASGVDLSTYKENLQKYIADPTSATVQDLRKNLSGMKHDYNAWVDSIAQNFMDYGSALDQFQNKNNVDLGKATQSLKDYANQVRQIGTDTQAIQKRFGNAAQPLIQFIEQNGTAYLGLADAVAQGTKKQGQAFIDQFKNVKTQAQITADIMSKSLGTAFNKVLQDFRVMFNAVVVALGHPPPFKINTEPAKAEIANLKESLLSLPTSMVFSIKGSYTPPPNKPTAAGGIIAGAAGFIAHSPTLLVGEGHSPTPIGPGAEAVIPLNMRGKRIMQEAFGELAGGRSTVFAPKATDLSGSVRILDWRRGILSMDAEVAWEEAVRSS